MVKNGITLNREEVLKGNWKNNFKGWKGLKWSKHALEKIRDRSNGLIPIIPKKVKIDDSNIAFGMSVNDRIERVGISLNYNSNKYLVLVLRDTHVVTAYFNPKNRKK